MSKRIFFKDPNFQKCFDQDGFVKINLFTEEEMQPLLDCYEKFAPNHIFDEGGFHHTTHHTKNWDLLQEVSESLLKIFQPKIDLLFNNVNTLAANFIIKDSGEETEFVPHQDWTLVDEQQYYSLNLWVPLHEVSEQNGALRILKGSQNFIRNIRCAPEFPILYEHVMPQVYQHLTAIPFKFGEAVIFDCGVLHGSFPNVSGSKRINAIVGLYSADAPFKFYYNTQQGNPPLIEEYHIKPEEFLTFAVGAKPSSRKPDRIFPYTFPQITAKQFSQKYSTAFWQRVKQLCSF